MADKVIVIPLGCPMPKAKLGVTYIHAPSPKPPKATPNARLVTRDGKLVHVVRHDTEQASVVQPTSVGKASHSKHHLIGRFEYVPGLKKRGGTVMRKWDKRAGKFVGPVKPLSKGTIV